MTTATRYFNQLPRGEQKKFMQLDAEKLHPSIAPESIIDRFAQTIEECSSTYRYGLDDYTNDLTVREIIQDILDAARVGAFDALRALLADLDRRFCAVTIELPEPIFAAALARRDRKKYFFYFRIPHRPGEEMVEDLVRMKLISSPEELG